MTINYTTLLGLAEPVTGTESGTWGDDVNKGITDYLDIAVAGTQTISGTQTAVTLSVTNGSSAGNGIVQAGTGTTGSSQYAIINCTGNPVSLLTITAPASSKAYIVINATTTSQSVKLVGAGPTTGVTIVSGEKAVVVWNGSDFVKVASSTAPSSFAAPVVIEGSTTDAALRITQTGSGNALLVEDSANPDSTPFVVDASGNVAIGGTPSGNQFEIFKDGIGTASMRSAAGGSYFYINRSQGTVASPTIIASGNQVGGVIFRGYDGASFIDAARISVDIDAAPGTNDMPGRLVFSTTADGASTPTERMRIDNAGRVGIGGTPSASYSVVNFKPMTGATTEVGYGLVSTIQSDVTNLASGYRTNLSTQATAFTLGTIYHFEAIQSALGASSTVTNQMGFVVGSTLTGATNNYGFYGSIASGTGRYNLYMAGTAANYLAGTLQVAAVVESTSGGFKFPDGTTQTTAASGTGSTSIGLVRAVAINCILP